MTVDQLQVLITANTDQLRKEISKTQTQISGLQKNVEKSTGGISKAFKVMATGIVALGIGKIIKDSVMNGVEAIESDNLFEVSMGKWADSTRTWSEEIQRQLGLNAIELRKNTGVIFNMVTSMGLAEKYAIKMSKGVSLLANDMASFYNMSTEEAFNKINAGLTGETEPLKRIGILVNDNTIKQVAYSEGIAKNGAELTEQQKVLARYVAILKQTSNAQGDLARTIDSPANQMRIFKSQLKDLSISFSNFLIPVLSAVLPYLNAFAKLVTSALNSLAKLMGVKGNGGSQETANISKNVGSIGSGLGDANKEAKKLKSTLAGFDEMNVLQEQDTSGAGGGGSTSGGSIDFDLGDYDAKLGLLNSKTDKIVANIKKTFGTIGDVIEKAWNSKPVQDFAFGVTAYATFMYDYFKTLGMDFYNNLTGTWGNIEGNVSTIISNLGGLWSTMWIDFGLAVQTYSQPIIDGVSNLFNSIWTSAIDPLIQNMVKMWTDFTGILVKLWDANGKPLLKNIGDFVVGTIALFQSIWDNVIDPIIKPLLETMSWLWEKHLKGMVEEIGSFIMKLTNSALEIWNKFINPIITWVVEKLAPVWTYLSSLIIGVFGTIVGAISDVVKSIFKILGGIVDFITGILTGNWKKAWQGFVDIFKGIIDGIVGIFKMPINLIIDGINAFIRGLNKIQIPDWVPAVGGKGLNIATIPKLATGGIIDRPTLAVVGEAGKEAVMPLENNTGWINELAGKIATIMGGGNGTPTQLIVKIGEDTILDKIIKGANDKAFERNEGVFVL